jgi:glycosyltransferase involved in cell wall biosynthesis
MRIGLFLECLPRTDGGFQQALSFVESLTRKNSTGHEFLVFTPFDQTRRMLLNQGIEAIRYKHSVVRLIDRWSATVFGGAILRRLRRLGFKHLGRHLDALLDNHHIDLVILTEIGETPLRIGEHPFIVTVWDLSHRDYPEFPLAYTDRLFERRERVLLASLTRSLGVIVDSRLCAGRVANLYQVDPHRIIVLPFLPSLGVRRHAAKGRLSAAERVRQKYDLPARYVFYPAFPGAEKNHLYLLEGLVALEQQHGIILHAVFCGGGPRLDWAIVERQVRALGLMARVKFLGWVPDEDFPALYQGALALVMPTYTGPTNLPPVEAVTLGCPVVYSDLPGCREQMGDAALYCDLNDASSLANHLAALAQDSALVDRLRKAGSRLAAEIAKVDYSERLKPVLDRYAYVRRRWTWPEIPRERTGRFEDTLGDEEKA